MLQALVNGACFYAMGGFATFFFILLATSLGGGDDGKLPIVPALLWPFAILIEGTIFVVFLLREDK